MYLLALTSGVGLTAFSLLTGEALNVLIAGFIPPALALAMGALIRYCTKEAVKERKKELAK